MPPCIKKIIVALVVTLPTQLYADINVVVQGIEHNRGFIEVRIYLDAQTWLKEDQPAEHIVVQAKKGDIVIPLPTFRGGRLAAVVYHDENSDGENKNLEQSILEKISN